MPQQPVLGRQQVLPAAAEPVDVALVLATDCSGSISNDDLALQFRGYARAVTSDAFIAAVQAGPLGRVALTFVTWAEASRQVQVVPWTLIDCMAATRGFVAALFAAPYPTPGYTSISGAIDFSRRLLGDCRYPSTRRVIDVSGNGTNNSGRDVKDARDEAVAAGITINGLPILGDQADIATYYAQNVMGGTGAFVMVVQNLAAFEKATRQKLVTEIAAVSGDLQRLS